MRFIVIATAAAFLLAPGAAPSFAHHDKAYEHAPVAKASKAKTSKKPKMKKQEYMRAAPSK